MPDFREGVGRAAFVSNALTGTQWAESLEDELGRLFPVSLVCLAQTSSCPNTLPGRGARVPAKGVWGTITQGLPIQYFSTLCRALPLPTGPFF